MKYLKGFNMVNEDIDSDGLSAQFPEEILLNFKEVKIQEDVHEIELKGSFLWNHRHNYGGFFNYGNERGFSIGNIWITSETGDCLYDHITINGFKVYKHK